MGNECFTHTTMGNECNKSLAMQLPMVINQILGELVMSLGIFNASMSCKKSFKPIRVPLGLHSGANIVIETWQVQTSFIFNDHVVKNHTTCHDINKSFL